MTKSVHFVTTILKKPLSEIAGVGTCRPAVIRRGMRKHHLHHQHDALRPTSAYHAK